VSSTETISVEGSGHECDAKLDTWLRDMLAVTPGCLPKVRKRALILACREFFEQTSTWRAVIGPKKLTALKKRYYLSPYDAYADVVQVLGVEFNGTPLKPMVRRPPGTEPDATQPQRYYLEGIDQVRLWPQSSVSVDDALTFYVALTPKQTVTHLPRVAATHFYDAIYDGALGRLYAQPAKAYTDPMRAQYHLNRFRAAIGKYAGQAKQGFAGAPSWSFPKFGK
jgi:hypothetical protein